VFVKKGSSQVTKLEARSEKGCPIGCDVEDGKQCDKAIGKAKDKGNVKIVDKPKLMEH
jgi:hypothetical protein